MIYYSREKKTLIIPEGIGSTTSADDYANGFAAGKAAQKAIDDAKITTTTAITQNGTYEANYGFKEVVVNVPSGGDCQEEIAEAYESGQTVGYNSGYTAGEAAQKAEDDGKIIPRLEVTTNGTYEADYGYNTVVVNVQCSGGSDCSSAITEAYQSGYSAGVADCSGVTPGELSSIYIDVAIIGGIIGAPSREITCNGYTYDTTGRRGYDLLETGHIIIVRTGTLQEKYITPTSVTFTVTNSEFGEWEQRGWSINEVRFDGLVDEHISSYTGGFKYTPTSTTTEVADENHMRIIITL